MTNPAPLLPKLRGHFAEFLNHGSLDRLGISLPDHLSRFGVRAAHSSLEVFLDSIGSPTSSIRTPHQVSGTCHPDLPRWLPTLLAVDNHRHGWAAFLRHPIA